MARPLKDFNSFYGQRRVVQTLRGLADEARARSSALPPLVLIGRAGAGKTSLGEALARQLANETGDASPTNFHVVHAGRGVLLRLREVLCRARHADVVLIDEAHALLHEDSELLYLALDRQETFAIDDDRRIDRTRFEPIAGISLVLATNIPGRIPKALYSRATPIELDEYTLRELREITQKVAQAHHLNLTPQAARAIAEHADGIPRRAEQLVKLVVALPCPGRPTRSHVEGVLRQFLGLDANGLTPHQQRLVRALADVNSFGMRAEQVTATLGLDAVYVRREIEGPLVRRGLLVVRADHRRQLSPKGLTLAMRNETDDEDAECPQE